MDNNDSIEGMISNGLRLIRSRVWSRYISVEIVLTVATLISIWIYWRAYIDQADLIKELSLAVGAATFSVLLTIVTINSIDDKREAANTKTQTELAFKQLVMTLNKHVVLIQLIYKSSKKKDPAKFPKDFHELFLGNFVEVLCDLDLSLAAGIIPKRETIWAKHLEFSINELRQELGDTLARFGHSLDIKDSLLVADLRNTTIFDYLRQIPVIIDFFNIQNSGNNFGLNKMILREQDISAYAVQLHNLIERINLFVGAINGVELKPEIWLADSNPILFAG